MFNILQLLLNSLVSSSQKLSFSYLNMRMMQENYPRQRIYKRSKMQMAACFIKFKDFITE